MKQPQSIECLSGQYFLIRGGQSANNSGRTAETDVFLTLEDPRAKIQGSRDPLGVQAIWTRFGREVVTNLTTVSRSVRGFAVLLLGRYFGERYVEEGRANEEDAVPIFLRTEQIAAYARETESSEADDDLILGITRVQRFRSEYSGKVPIRNDATGFILSDQKTYGLWGLYSVAARVSGLLADGPVGLTPWAREFVEKEYISRLRPVERLVDKFVIAGGFLDTRKNQQPFATVARLLTGKLSAKEREFFAQALRDADKVQNALGRERQRQLAELLQTRCQPDQRLGRADVVDLHVAAQRNGHDSLTDKLQRILRLEAVLAPSEYLFELLQARNGQTPASIARHLTDQWGSRVPNLSDPLEPLRSEIHASVDEEQTQQIHACDNALAHGAYKEAIHVILDWNRTVMAARGSAPWVKLTNGKLDVRYRSRESWFPAGDELAGLWRNTYFLDALKDVTFQLKESTNAKR